MSDMIRVIEELLSEANSNAAHEKNRTNDGKKKDSKTEKPTGGNESPDTQGVLGGYNGAASDAGGDKDVGDMNKGKIASGASDNTSQVSGGDGPINNDNSGMDDKAPGKEKGKFSSDASGSVEANKGPHKQGSDEFETKSKLKESDDEEESEDELEESGDPTPGKGPASGKKGKLDHDNSTAGGGDSSPGKGPESTPKGKVDYDNSTAGGGDSSPGKGAEKTPKKKPSGGHSPGDPSDGVGESIDNPGDDDGDAIDKNMKEGAEGETLKKVSGESNREKRPDEEKGDNAPKNTGKDITDADEDGHNQANDPNETKSKLKEEDEEDEMEEQKIGDMGDKSSSDTQGVLGKTKGAALDGGRETKSKLKEEADDLDEEFKEKAAIIFETQVNHKVNTIRESLEREYEDKLQEELAEANAKIEEYVDYAVQEWISENALTIKYSLRTEIAENFIQGMKTLFAESYIDIPEEEISVVDELTEEVESYRDQLAEMQEEMESMKSQILESRRHDVFRTVSEDLTHTQSIKLEELSESVEAADIEEYEYKLNKLKESYFTGENASYTLTEEVLTGGEAYLEEDDSTVNQYASYLSRIIK